MSKQVPFVEMPAGSVLDAPLADGEYAVITHGRNSKLVLTFMTSNPFPWHTVRFRFENGEAQEVGYGTSPAHELGRHNILKVFLMGIDATQRAELDKLLARDNIELVPADPA